MSNYRIAGICAAVYLLSLYQYYDVSILAKSNQLNLAVVFIAMLVLGKSSVVLMPLLIFSPIQIHSGFSLFSTVLIYNVAVRFNDFKQLTKDDVLLLLLSMAFAIFVLLGVFLNSYFDKYSYYVYPYFKLLLVVLFFLLVSKDAHSTTSLLVSVFVFAALSLLFKLLFVENSEQILSVSSFDDDLVAGLGTIFHEGVFEPRLLFALQEPNYTSFELLCAAAIGVSIIFNNRYFNEPKWDGLWAKFLFYVLLVSIGIQVIGTFSRSGLISFVLLILLGVKFSGKNIVFAFVLFVFGAVYVFWNDALFVRVFSIGGDSTFTGRSIYWSWAFESWAQAPIFGGGLSSYLDFHKDAAHSTWLEWMADFGLFGVGFLFVIFTLAKRSFERSGVLVSNLKVFLRFFPLVLMLQTVTYYQVEFLFFLLFVVLLSCRMVNEERDFG